MQINVYIVPRADLHSDELKQLAMTIETWRDAGINGLSIDPWDEGLDDLSSGELPTPIGAQLTRHEELRDQLPPIAWRAIAKTNLRAVLVIVHDGNATDRAPAPHEFRAIAGSLRGCLPSPLIVDVVLDWRVITQRACSWNAVELEDLEQAPPPIPLWKHEDSKGHACLVGDPSTNPMAIIRQNPLWKGVGDPEYVMTLQPSKSKEER